MLRTAVLLALLVMPAASCTTSSPSSSPSTTSSKSTRHDVLRLVEAAEAAHHCAGEEATDDARAAELTQCVSSQLKTARSLLPGVIAANSMQPDVLATVRLFVDDSLDDASRAALCKQVSRTDSDGMLDDEARAVCGIAP